MARVVVDVMPKPEILDPQGKAVTGALARLGFQGVSVRQGKRFELELDGEATQERLAEVRQAVETLLANTVIETFDVRVDPSTGDVRVDPSTGDVRVDPSTGDVRVDPSAGDVRVDPSTGAGDDGSGDR